MPTCKSCNIELKNGNQDLCLACLLEVQSDRHFTFSEDKNPNPQAGYKFINLNVFFRKYPELITWHDKITTSGSFAQKVGIPNWAVAAAWKAMIEHRLENPDMYKQGFIKLFWRSSEAFMKHFQRFWYEGPLDLENKPKTRQDPDSGDMF